MRCPSCLVEFQESVDACKSCGFTLSSLDKKFGTVPKNFRYLTDTVPYFEKGQQLALEKKLKEMERNFPGLYISIMTMEVHRLFKPREYLFWLMNRCHFSPLNCRLERSFSIVLFFDPVSRSVFLTTGYGLQNSLNEERLRQILELAVPDFQKENFYGGTLTILKEIKRQLKIYCATGLPEPMPLLSAKGAPANDFKPVEDLF